MELQEKIINILRLNGNLTSLMISELIKWDHIATCDLLKEMFENNLISITESVVNWEVTEIGLSVVNDVFQQKEDIISLNDYEIQNQSEYHVLASNLRKIHFGLENSIKDIDIWQMSVDKLTSNLSRKILIVETINNLSNKDKILDSLGKSHFNFNISDLSKHIERGCLNFITQIKIEIRQYLTQLGFDELRDSNIVEIYFPNYNQIEKDIFNALNEQNGDILSKVNVNINSLCLNLIEETNKKTLLCDHLMGYLLQTLDSVIDSQSCSSQLFRFFSFGKFFSELEKNVDSIESHSVKGVILEKDISFGELVSTVLKVFNQVGLQTIVIKPLKVNHFKPNVNLLCYHEELDEWMQVGSCGMVHPNVLKQTKLGNGLFAGAFIISLEAIIMIKCGIITAKDIVGSFINLDQLKNSPLFV